MNSHDNDILGGGNLSPNIKNLADEQEQEERVKAEQQAAAKKERETVAIDGVAFHEDEIDYHSKDIQHKDSKNLFTRVEGAERHKREEQERALKYAVAKKEAKERFEHDLKRSNEERVRAEAENKKQAEEAAKQAEKERQRYESERRANEELKIKTEQKRIAAEKKRQHAEEKRSISKKRRSAIKNALFAGWHKFVTFGILLAIIIVAGVFAVKKYVVEPAEIAHREATSAKKMYYNSDYQKQFEEIDHTLGEMIERGASKEERMAFLEEKKNSVSDPDVKIMVEVLYLFNNGWYEQNYSETAEKILELADKSDKSFVKEFIYRRVSQCYSFDNNEELRDYYAQKAEEYK